MLPAALHWSDKDAAQILSLRILVLISDWLRDAAMTLYYGPLRHVPLTNRIGEMASCEAPGIPWWRKLIQSTQFMMHSGYSGNILLLGHLKAQIELWMFNFHPIFLTGDSSLLKASLTSNHHMDVILLSVMSTTSHRHTYRLICWWLDGVCVALWAVKVHGGQTWDTIRLNWTEAEHSYNSKFLWDLVSSCSMIPYRPVMTNSIDYPKQTYAKQ